MIKVLTVLGTRPEAIKLAPVIKELERRRESFSSRVCVTGQHRELLDQMLDLFGIRPDHDLALMSHDQSPTDVAVAVLRDLGRVLDVEQPHWVVVQGDTTTTMAGGLGAFHHGCRVAHVEAGLRTFDQRDPWPEEVNRRVAGVVADLHFAPTQTSAANLYREGVGIGQVFVTGNTVIDALELVRALPFETEGTVLGRIPLEGKRIVVVTMHRRETSQEAIAEICAALVATVERHHDVQIVCPVHPNPNLRHAVRQHLAGYPSISLVAPLDYRRMIWLLEQSHFVVTDSGGVQEEATAIGKPVLVVRRKTERLEGVTAGNARVVGADRETIESWATRLLTDSGPYAQMARSSNTYGNGQAARAIVDILYEHSLSSTGQSRSKRETAGATAVGLRTWLSSRACQSASGAFVGWLDRGSGRQSYEYPEITGYTLSYLAWLGSLSDAELVAGHRAAAWLTARVQAGALAARDGWDNGAIYLFDLGMIASGLMSYGRRTESKSYLEAGLRLANLVREEVSTVRLISPIWHLGPPSRRAGWSTHGIPHLAKLVQALLLSEELGADSSRSVSARLIEAVTSRQEANGRMRTDDQTGTVMLHPHLYAAEGLWIWGSAVGDHEALERAEAALEWALAQQLELGGFPRSAPQTNTAAVAVEQSDVTAQVARLALALRMRSPSVDRAIERLVQTTQPGSSGVAMVYQSGSPTVHLNTWATLFAAQALELATPDSAQLSWRQLV